MVSFIYKSFCFWLHTKSNKSLFSTCQFKILVSVLRNIFGSSVKLSKKIHHLHLYLSSPLPPRLLIPQIYPLFLNKNGIDNMSDEIDKRKAPH